MRHRREDLSNSGGDRYLSGNSYRERNIFHEQHSRQRRSLDLNINKDGNNTDRSSDRSVQTSLAMYVGTSSPERSVGTCHARSFGTNQQERYVEICQSERSLYNDLRRPNHDWLDTNYRHKHVRPSRLESVTSLNPTASYNTCRNNSRVSYSSHSHDYVHVKDTNPSVWSERCNKTGSRFQFPQQEQLMRRDISQLQNGYRLMAPSYHLAQNCGKSNPVVATVTDVGPTEKWPSTLPDITAHHRVSVCRPDETFEPAQLTDADSYLKSGSNMYERKDVPQSFPPSISSSSVAVSICYNDLKQENIMLIPPPPQQLQHNLPSLRKYPLGILEPNCLQHLRSSPLEASQKPVPQLRQLLPHRASRHPAQKQPPKLVFHHPVPQQPQLRQPPLHLQESLQLPHLLATFMQPHHPAPPQPSTGTPQPCHSPPPLSSRIPPVYVFPSDFQTAPIDTSWDQVPSSICKPNYLDNTKSEQKTQKMIIPLEELHKQDRKLFQQRKDEKESYINCLQILGNPVSNDRTRENCDENGHVDTKGRRPDVNNTDYTFSLVKICDSENISLEDKDFSDEQKEKNKNVKLEKEVLMKDCDTFESKMQKYEHANRAKNCKKQMFGTFIDKAEAEVTGQMAMNKICASNIVQNDIPSKKLNNVQDSQPCLVDCGENLEMHPCFHPINAKRANFLTYGRRIDNFTREIFDHSKVVQMSRKAYYIHRPWEPGTCKIPRVTKRKETEGSKEKVRVDMKPHKRKFVNDNLRKRHVSRKDKYEISKSEIHAEKSSLKIRKHKIEISNLERDADKGSGKKRFKNHIKTEKDELNKTCKSITEATCKETVELKCLHPKLRHKRIKACFERKRAKKKRSVVEKCNHEQMSVKGAMTVGVVDKFCARNDAHVKEFENEYERLKQMPCCLTSGKFCLSAPNTFAVKDLKKSQDRVKEKTNNNSVDGNEILDKALFSMRKHLLYRAHAINALTRDKCEPLIAKKPDTRKSFIATNMAKQELGIHEQSLAAETDTSVYDNKENKDQTFETNKNDIRDDNFNVDGKCCEKNVLALDMSSTIYQPHRLNIGSDATRCLLGPVVSSTYYRAPEKSQVIRNAKECLIADSKSSIDLLTETAHDNIEISETNDNMQISETDDNIQISETNDNVQEQLVIAGEFLDCNISNAEKEQLQIPVSCSDPCIHPSAHQLALHGIYLHTKQEISASLDGVESNSGPIPVLPALLPPDVSSIIDTQNCTVSERRSLHGSCTSGWNRVDLFAPELSNLAQPATLDLMNSAHQIVPGLSNPAQLFDAPNLSNSAHTALELSYPTCPTSGLNPNAQHLIDVGNQHDQQSRFESESDLNDSTDSVNISREIYDPSNEDFEMYRDSQIQRVAYSDVKSQGSPYCGIFAGYDKPEYRRNSQDTNAINMSPIGREPYDTDGAYSTSGAFLCTLPKKVDVNQLDERHKYIPMPFEDEEPHNQCDFDAVDRNAFETKLGDELNHVDVDLKCARNMFEDFVCDILQDEKVISSVPIYDPQITNELDCVVKLEQTYTINKPENGFKSARTPLHLRTCRKPRFEKRFPKPLPKARPHKVLCGEMELYKAAQRFLGDFDCSHKRSCKAKYELLVNPITGKMESIKVEKEKIERHIKKNVKHEAIEDPGSSNADVKDDWAALDKPCVEDDRHLIKTSKDGEIQSRKDLRIISLQQIAMKNLEKSNLNKRRNISTSGKIPTLSIESDNRIQSIRLSTVKHRKSENYSRLPKLWHVRTEAGKNIKTNEQAKFKAARNQSLSVTKDKCIHDTANKKSKMKVKTRTNREMCTESPILNGSQSKTSQLIQSHLQAFDSQSNTCDSKKCDCHQFCSVIRKERKTSIAKKDNCEQPCEDYSNGRKTCEAMKQKHTKLCKEICCRQSKASDANNEKHAKSSKETGSQQSKTSNAKKINKQKSSEEVDTQNTTKKMKKHAQSRQEAGSLQDKTIVIWQGQNTKSDMEADNKKANISGVNRNKHACQVCSFTCSLRADLKLHYNFHHSNWCLRCAKEFKDQVCLLHIIF